MDAVTAEARFMEDLLARLVEAPTVLGNEEPGQALMQEAFRALGLDAVDVPLDPDALRAHPAASPFSWDVSGKTNVVATWPSSGNGGRSLILNGHIDVVPAGSESLWRTAPFRAHRDGDWLYGRGSGDMKAGLAAIVGAVRGLQRLGLAPDAPVQLQSVVEEECTGNGALQCVLSCPAAEAAVIPEPFPGAITISQVGVLWFRVTITGVPAHVGLAGAGFNAIEAAYPIIEALRGLEAELNEEPPAPYDGFEQPIKLNVGTIQGGDWPSTVASDCSLAFRIALYPGRRIEELRELVEATVTAAANGSRAEVVYDGFACEGSEVPADAPLVQTLGTAYERVAGTAAHRTATTATTDASAFVGAGIPAVCLGPHAENIHGIDERVSIPSMIETAQVLGLFIRDWCGLS